MTEREKKAFEFIKQKGYDANCESVKLACDNWKGYTVYVPQWTKILVTGMPLLILEKNNLFSTKQDYECLQILRVS